MKKHFYSHLVQTEVLDVRLEELELSQDEKTHLKNLIHTNIHAVVLDTVLSHIHEKDKKMFLTRVEKGDHDEIWDFLHKRSINIEARIKKNIKSLILEFESDVNALHKKK